MPPGLAGQDGPVYTVNMSSDVISVRIPHEMKVKLDELAKTTHRPASFYVKQALEVSLDRLEWTYSVAARVEGARSGTDRGFSLDESLADLNLTHDDLDNVE